MAVLETAEPKTGDLQGLTQASLKTCGVLASKLPASVLRRGTQMALDALLCALALLLAYQLRFDGAVPSDHARVMWAWMLMLPVLRPLMLVALGSYEGIWRYFNLRDAGVLVFSSLPPTLLLVIMRYGFAPRLWFALVPWSVILIELGVFLCLAATMRAFRRASFEAARDAAVMRHVVIVGNDATL